MLRALNLLDKSSRFVGYREIKGDFYMYLAPKRIFLTEDYEGHSGGHILDLQGRIFALACVLVMAQKSHLASLYMDAKSY